MKKFFTPPLMAIIAILVLTLMLTTASAAESCPDCGGTMAAANCVTPPTCTSCGYKDWDTGKDSNNHGELVVENRFDNQGSWHFFRCTRCNSVTTSQELCRYSNWKYVDDSEHIGTCSVCGMTATYDHHDADGYASDSSKHYFECTACSYSASATHTYGDWTSAGTSLHSRLCTVCSYKNSARHTFGSWTRVDGTSHKRTCTGCGYAETANHSGGTASCTAKAVCTACNSSYGSLADHVMETYQQAANMYNESTHTLNCENCSYSVTSAHTLIRYACNNDELHRVKCRDCVYYFFEDHSFSYTDNGSNHTGICTQCNDDVTSSHNYGSWKAVNENTHKRTCSDCGHAETANHSWKVTKVTPATCVSKKVTESECTVCGAGKHVTGAEYADHTFGNWTLVDSNNHQRTCSICNYVQTEAHTGGTATCLTAGVCTVCNGEYIPATGHLKTYSTTVKKPSCATGEAGLVEIRCVACDALISTTKPTAQHVPEMTTIVAATCCEDGYSQLICKNCKQAVNNGQKYPIAATGEHIEDWRVTKAATCSAEGVETLYCGRSNKLLGDTRVISKTAHPSTSRVQTQAPTCTTNGAYNIVCDVCHTVIKSAAIEKTGHQNPYMKTTEATCTTDGKVETYCGVCNVLLDTSTITKKGHNLNSGVTTPATCTAAGKTVKTCQRSGCNYTETTTIPMVDHVEGSPVVSPEATCCNTGLKSWYCVNCKKLLRTQTIPALGHHSEGSYKWVRVKEPNCTEEGLEKKVCAHSGNDLGDTRTIPALGHVYMGLWEVGESDTHYRNCYRCGSGRKIVECTYLPLIIDDVQYQVCPVCGRFHDQKLEAVTDAATTLATGSKPGTSLVRMLAQPFGADELRYPIIMTAIFEAEGLIAEPAEDVSGITVSVPLSTEASFKLVFVHMDDVTGQLVWTDVPYDLINNVLTFTVEEMGLFLFVAE